ncbi:hypothetical protein N9F40_01670 [bacterium]|nr:hypothetical protein [bacterium]
MWQALKALDVPHDTRCASAGLSKEDDLDSPMSSLMPSQRIGKSFVTAAAGNPSQLRNDRTYAAVVGSGTCGPDLHSRSSMDTPKTYKAAGD